MNDTDVTQLITLISTKSRLNRFLRQIEEVERALFNKKTDSKKLFEDNFTVSEADVLSNIASSSQFDMLDPQAFSVFLKEVSRRLRETPVVSLYLAYEPTLTQANEFSDWFVRTFDVPVILDIQYDSQLIGGAIVEHGGRRFDFSLKKKVFEFS